MNTQLQLPGTDNIPAPITFGHVADVHLGLRQFRGEVQVKRLQDFAAVWIEACQAMSEKCEFVLLCGDLYDSNKPSEFARSAAAEGLGVLKRAGVPVYAIWGNHDGLDRDGLSPLHRLEEEGYLRVVNSVHTPYWGESVSTPSGIGVDIMGIPWQGAGTRRALDEIPIPKNSRPSILMAHCGLVGLTPINMPETLSPGDFTNLGFDYVALGHVHRPYHDGLVFMPGSLETCKRDEAFYPERGYFIATMDANRPDDLVATLFRPRKRRPCISTDIELPSWNVLRGTPPQDGAEEDTVRSIRFSGVIDESVDIKNIKGAYSGSDALIHTVIDATRPAESAESVDGHDVPEEDIEAQVMSEALGEHAVIGSRVMEALTKGISPDEISKMILEEVSVDDWKNIPLEDQADSIFMEVTKNWTPADWAETSHGQEKLKIEEFMDEGNVGRSLEETVLLFERWVLGSLVEGSQTEIVANTILEEASE